MDRNIELLAPAGSYDGLLAAMGAGADAVYVGGSAFGARAYAKNFQQEELLDAIRYVHLHGKKLYLTVNTLIKNTELQRDLYQYLAPYYEAGLDAVIVQDYGVLKFVKEQFPGLPIHASTQMAVTGKEGMKLLECYGVRRVVTARELSLSEIKDMHNSTNLEIESFIHGALCYSYSGMCLMSSMFGGRSGNRGRCAQPCRLPYETFDQRKMEKGGADFCPLSLKDICTIDLLPEILEAGVTSLKIEGRMKQPAYTAGVTAMYRKYLDQLSRFGAADYKVTDPDRETLLGYFSRGGSSKGYYDMPNGPDMMAFSNAKKVGIETGSIAVLQKLPVSGELILYPGCASMLRIRYLDKEILSFSAEVQYAKNQPMDEAAVRSHMDKMGDSPFEWDILHIQMGDSVFLPVKNLKDLRRNACKQLEMELLAPYQRKLPAPLDCFPKTKNHRRIYDGFYISCEDAETAKAILQERYVKGLYVPLDIVEDVFAAGSDKGIEIYLSMPYIARGVRREEELAQLKDWIHRGLKGILVRNLETFSWLYQNGLGCYCVADSSLYTWNDLSVSFFQAYNILKLTAPLELNEGELRHRNNEDTEMIIYGYAPLMISAQCVQKNVYGCTGRNGQVSLRDRYKKAFPVQCVCSPWNLQNTNEKRYCYNIIYNSIPTGLINEKQSVEALGMRSLRLAFTIETKKEALQVYRNFCRVYMEGKKAPDLNFTKGHFKRGAE
ncbi:MAG: U32 family peptidase [Blautia sp.]|nr:U32 family peptidase [Blautia sp.]